ncbi:MAG: MFS transporter [Balneolia bacterium]|nr:MFS transporter [Balneolia bacterium]
MSFYAFFKDNARLLLFGVLLTFFSGFGQTFLFSLFLPAFQEEFSLSSGGFGTFYSAATLTSALLLPWIGALIDRYNLRRYTLAAILVMAVSAATISFSYGLVMLFAGILGVRHTGQALMGHISQTTMARYFDHVRGKALSIASLGHPLGEAILPVSVALIIGYIGWRHTYLLIAAFVLVAGFLLIPYLLKNQEERYGEQVAAREEEEKKTAEEKGLTSKRSWTRAEMLRDSRFYFIIPNGLAAPIMLTGFFLYQVPLAEYKGWTVEWLATCFVGFAAARVVFSLVSGPLIDKITARRVYPFMLIPMAVGFVLLLYGAHPAFAMAYMMLLGVTEGIGANAKTAMFAEVYGVLHLGAIRSTLVSIMVFSTAAAPIVMGNMLDAGIEFSAIIIGALIFIAVSMLFALRILPVFDSKTED